MTTEEIYQENGPLFIEECKKALKNNGIKDMNELELLESKCKSNEEDGYRYNLQKYNLVHELYNEDAIIIECCNDLGYPIKKVKPSFFDRFKK